MEDNHVEQTEKTFDESYVKELRKEAAAYRTRLREEEERNKEISEKYESLNKSLLDKEILFTAKELGAVDPHTVAKLVDRESLSKDEEGNLNIREAIEGLITEKPFLKGGSIGRASNPSNVENTSKVYSKQDLSKMSPQEVNANWADIEEQMSKGLIK